jgi:peroxiredoxin
MPVMQAFAQAAAGKVGVVGVDTRDPASYGSAYVADHKLTYPMLSDPDAKLSAALGANYLPVTLFIQADGGLAHVYVNSKPLDQKTLADLVNRYLGVRVAG